jgi:hypothetical protein
MTVGNMVGRLHDSTLMTDVLTSTAISDLFPFMHGRVSEFIDEELVCLEAMHVT